MSKRPSASANPHPSTTMKKHIRRRIIRAIILASLLALAGFSINPAIQLGKAISGNHQTRDGLPAGHVDDASRLNQTKVSEVWHIPVDTDDTEAQLAELLERAQKHRLKVSVAGAKHSMGGHTIYPDGIVINTASWNGMELDVQRNILKVQSGALWSDILPYLNKLGKSVAIMQSNHSFSVGGSISVNCHGWQYGRPPIASSVESFRIMLADGTIQRCSREENRELFSLALGGYGLFGIILDVELRVVPNELYRIEQHIVPVDQSMATFDGKIKNQPGLQMVYARMSIVPEDLLGEVILNAFYSVPGGQTEELTDPTMIELRRSVFRGSAESDFGKKLRWNAETKLQPTLKDKNISRNQLFNEGVEVFENRSTETTDILHEYFVPRHRAPKFVNAMRKILREHEPNLLNVTVRSVERDEDTFLRYADQQMIAFVMLYVQQRTDAGERAMESLTQELIDAALENKGRYYLPYRLHATQKQFHRAYPRASEFFTLKRKYDPQELFQNQFYLKYGSIQR